FTEPAGALLSRPRYQPLPVRQPVLPRFELKFATMSDSRGSRSLPALELASATGYQVLPWGAPVKSASRAIGAAAPSTALVASQSSGVNEASITIGTGLLSEAAQTVAAYWNAISRCSPRVVPGLPPTGVAGVGSLKPTPGSF